MMPIAVLVRGRGPRSVGSAKPLKLNVCLIAGLVTLAACGLIKTSSSTPLGVSAPDTSADGGGGGAGNGPIVMPNLVGMTEEQAAVAVKSAGFVLHLDPLAGIECENPPKVEGLVNCQAPDAGKSVPHNTLVQVTVYHDHMSQGGKDALLLRTLIGMTPDAAKAKVDSWHRGWKVRIITPTNSGGGTVYDAKCGDNKVCGIANLGQGGYDIDPLQFEVNAKRTIAAPPPD
jgi:hypothetical protein